MEVRRGHTRGPIDVKDLGHDEMKALAVSLGQAPYRGKQLFRWVHGRGAKTFGDMANLPQAFRQALADVATIGRLVVEETLTGRDQTVKTLFRLPSGRKIEAVLIPDLSDDGAPRRLTVCISSQVGCAMACSFCATGLMGFQENLTAGTIVDQVRMLNGLAQERFDRSITNVVYMGMGEPLLNYRSVLQSLDLLTHADLFALSPRRITVSTVGLARRIRQLACDNPRVNLAVSLHAPSQEKRDDIMPAVRGEATSLSALCSALTFYSSTTGRSITFEYCLFRDFNDSEADAERLASVCKSVPSKVNIIQYNPVTGLPFERTSEDQLNAFIRVLVAHGVVVTVRRSRGQDIDAACGQLALARRITSPP